MAEKGAARGMAQPVLTVGKTHSIGDLKMYGRVYPGTPLDGLTFSVNGRTLENDDHSITVYGLQPGEYHLVTPSDDPDFERQVLRPQCKRVVDAHAGKTNFWKRIYSICISPKSGSRDEKHPDLEFDTIRLSCDSDTYDSSSKRYAGFILYGWKDDVGYVRDKWELGGKRCKSAYMVIQDSSSAGVKRYIGQTPGQVHGAVYWNVFGKGADPYSAIGEGFSVEVGSIWGYTLKYTSGVFTGHTDVYRDSERDMAGLTQKCVEYIVKDWWNNSSTGKTYQVKDLVNWV